MRTARILDSRRTRQQVVQHKFALRLKARFNHFRDSAGCTIAMRWQRRVKSNSSEDQSPLLETQTRHGAHFLRASFAERRISPPSKTEVLTSSGKKSFDTGATIWRTTAPNRAKETPEDAHPVEPECCDSFERFGTRVINQEPRRLNALIVSTSSSLGREHGSICGSRSQISDSTSSNRESW